MTNVKISDLTENTNPSGQEELVYADNWSNWKVKLDTIKNFNKDWLQETKYKTDVEIDPNTMVELWDSQIIIESPSRVNYQEFSWYYSVRFTPGSSIIDVYSREDDSYEWELVHTFDAGFAPISWMCQSVYLQNNVDGSRVSLILWNKEKMATFIAPKSSPLHFSNETHFCVWDTIDWTVPFSSVLDINMFDPSEFQVSSLSFVWIYWSVFAFGKIAFLDDYDYVNTITWWNGQDSFLDRLAPQPGTVVSCKNIQYNYVWVIEAAYYWPSGWGYTESVRCISWSNVERRGITNGSTDCWITGNVLFSANINIGSNKTLWTFTTTHWTAGWKLWWPIDLSEYYLWYWAKDLFLKANDSTILKTTNLKASWQDSCTDNETYRWAVIKEQVEWVRSAATSITNWKYKYSQAIFSLNYPCFVLLQWEAWRFEYGKYWDCVFAWWGWNEYYLYRHEYSDGSDYIVSDNPIVSENYQNFSSLWLSSDWTKIMYTTEDNKFWYYQLPNPYDFENLGSYPTLEVDFVSAVESAWYSVQYQNNFVTPDWNYLYIQSTNHASCYRKFSLQTPFNPSLWVTYIDETWVLYDGTSHTEKVNLWYSLNWMFFQLHNMTFKLQKKYDLMWASMRNVIDNYTDYVSTPASPTETVFICGNWYYAPNPDTAIPSWNWTINAVAESCAPVADTTSTSTLNITNLTTVFTPTENFTLSCWNVLPWMSYIIRLTSWATAYTMTLGASITNPYNETLTLTASKTTTIVLLAISDTELEIQSVRTAA